MEDSRDESYITRKMEEMKKRNEEILRRHMEIEQDKMLADKFSSTVKAQRKDNVVERKVSSTATARPQRIKVSPTQRLPAAQPMEPEEKKYHRFSDKDAPPPDPNFNFLSDPSRNRSDSTDEENWRTSDKTASNNTWGQSRRHHSNYGGSDFKNVKSTMQKHRSTFKKDLAGIPPRDSDMTLHMTGRERIKYEEWKQERNKVDQERIQRQLTSHGTWRREWDSHKAVEHNLKRRQTDIHDLEIDVLCNSLERQRLEPKITDSSVGQAQKSEAQEVRRSTVNIPSADTNSLQGQISRGNPRTISQEAGKLSITLHNQPKQVQDETPTLQTFKPQPNQLNMVNPKKIKLADDARKSRTRCWTFLKPNVVQRTHSWGPEFSNFSMQLYPGWQTSFYKDVSGEGVLSSPVSPPPEIQSLENQIQSEILLNKQNLQEARNLPVFLSESTSGSAHFAKQSPRSTQRNSSLFSEDSSEIYYSDDNSPRSDTKITDISTAETTLCVDNPLSDDDDQWESDVEM